MVTISLIIPAYNAGKFLDATLRSVHQQDMTDFECIVVDDFSSDDTLDIAKSWRLKDRRIRIITQRAQSGVSAARNAGLRAARGALCAFLDADDLIMRNGLSARVQAWQKAVQGADPSGAWRVAGSYCGSETIPEKMIDAPDPRPTQLPPIGFATVGGRCPFNANQPMIRRDVLLEVGGFNETMSQAEDYDLWSRILRAGYWFVPAPYFAVTYRNRAGSAVRKSPLLHMHASLAIHNAGDEALDDDVLSRSPGRLVKPHHKYVLQVTKSARVLQFCGMDMGSEDGRPIEEIADIIHQHLPDLPDVMAPTASVRNLLAAGIKRQSLQPPTAEGEAQITRLIGMLAERRKDDTMPRRMAASVPFGPFGEEGPDRLWHPDRQGEIDVLFLPHKDYHAWTVGLAAPAMRAAGIKFAIVDMSAQWREAGVMARAKEMGLPVIPYGEVALGAFAPRLVVAFNDWDFVTRPVLVAAEQAGIATAAIVEGIQDYLDADTGRQRHAYRTAQTVLLPGDFDRRYFPQDGGQTLSVAGIPRIQLLRKQYAERCAEKKAARNGVRRVLINSNFSHNVMTEHRDGWLTQAVNAVRRAGYEPVISRHPEDKGTLFPELVTKDNFYDTLDTCVVSIQRFASGILESLASGVPVIYFNPHGELVDKFSSDPMGAYDVITSEDSLVNCLNTLPQWRDRALACADSFLDHHAGGRDMDSGQAIAEGLVRAMGPKPDADTLARFWRNLRIIDVRTDALTRREMIFDNPATAVNHMADMAQTDVAPDQQVMALVGTRMALKPPRTRTVDTAEPDTEKSDTLKPDMTKEAMQIQTIVHASPPQSTVVWRGRVYLHHQLERAYHASARWPRFHRLARRAGEYYIKHFSPF